MGHDQEDTQIIMMPSKTKGRGEKKTGGGKERLSKCEREGRRRIGGGITLLCVVSESPSK